MMKKLAIILVSLMSAFTGVGPAQAFPTVTVNTGAVSSDVQQVQDQRLILRGSDRRNNSRYDRRDNRRDRYSNNRRYDNRRYDRRYDNRRRNNAGAIIGGLAAGAIIGGAIASQNRNGSSCAARYRSYRASDNTYQPNSGPRRVCR